MVRSTVTLQRCDLLTCAGGFRKMPWMDFTSPEALWSIAISRINSSPFAGAPQQWALHRRGVCIIRNRR